MNAPPRRPAPRIAALGLAALLAAASCDGGAPDPAPVADPADIEELQRLAALGYVSGSVEATADSGVTLHARARAAPGYNLVLSGHEPGASLIDMDGELLHTWSTGFHEVWPGREMKKHFRTGNFFRRVHLFENGDLLAVWARSAGILRLDRDSRVVWARTVPAHHDLQVLPDGRIVVLTMENHVREILLDPVGEVPVVPVVVALAEDGSLVAQRDALPIP